MPNDKHVLTIGFLPEVPGPLSPAEVTKGLNAAKVELDSLGFPTDLCLVPDDASSAVPQVERALRDKPYACVCIGAGMRIPPEHTQLLEKLVNAVHVGAPHARICFNVNPADTVNAVRRWVQS